VAITAFLSIPPAGAQTSTAEIDLTVVDATGAVVPGAKVTLTGAESGNLVRTLSTNEQGAAVAPLLQPQTYDIGVSAAGFNNLNRKGIDLRVGEILNLRLQLETGSTSETVTVVGQTPLLEEKSGSLAQVIEERSLLQLPLNGRNYLQLANLTAGAVPSRGTRDQTFSAYGNNGLQNAFVLDGARNENYLRGLDNRARDMLRPPLDALSEFSVQTSNYSAEFGASAGGVVSAVTKTGTNQLHGSAYDFLRNSSLDAAEYFALDGNKPLLVRNQYGGALGGPLIRNRAWLFGAYEGTHIRNESAVVATVPTPEMRNGNFGSTPIFDPSSTRPNPAGSGSIRTQYPNNNIPASQFNQTGQKLLERYPNPNLPGLGNNFGRNTPNLQGIHNSTLRGDVQVSAKDSMFGRLSIVRQTQSVEAALPAPAQTPANRATDSQGLGYGYTRTFSPTLVNEFRFTWTRLTLNQDARLPRDEIIPGLLDTRITSSIPTFNVTSFSALGAQPGCCGNSPLIKSSGVWNASDNISKSYGRHLLKAGLDLQWIRPRTFSALQGRGTMNFTGSFTQDPQRRLNTGSGVADLLLGIANAVTTGSVADSEERGRYAGAYFQDSWTVSRSLTLSLGIRYELFLPYVEVHNQMANFILEPRDPLFGRLVVSGDPAKPRSLLATDKNNWAPRVGLAYRVPGVSNLVVRASYGIFYAQDEGLGVTSRMTNNPPFFGFGGITQSSDQVNLSTAFLLSSGALPKRPPAIDPKAFVLAPGDTTTLRSWEQRYTTGYVQEWHLTLEKQLLADTVLSVSYVGNSATHLWGQSQGNQPFTPGPGTVNSRRPLARYTIAPVNRFGPWNRAHFEGTSARAEKRLSRGVSFLTAFTFGHAIDLQNAALDLCDNCGNGNSARSAYNLNAEKGPSDNNVKLRLAFGGVWDLPMGKSHAVLNHGVAAALAGGWQLSGIYQAQTGPPFTVSLSFDNPNVGGASYPNRLCNGAISNPSPQRYFDTGCFEAPPAYTFGNSGRNILYGPGTNNADLALHRIFHLKGEAGPAVEFRAEGYNVFNHPQFGLPNSTIGNVNAGQISGTTQPARQLQFALRVSW
jgi:hypothetical protein